MTASDTNALGAAGAGNETSVANSTLLLNGVTVAEAVNLNGTSVLQGSGTSGTSGTVTLGSTGHTINDGGGTMTLSGTIRARAASARRALARW